MADTPASAPKPAAKVVAAGSAPLISPWATHMAVGMRDEILSEIDAFHPKDACPKHLAIAKDAAKAMIAALPEAARGAEVRMECTGHVAKQILVQVTPALVKKN